MSNDDAPLLSIIKRMIKSSGPLSIAQYMQLCHSHPEHGYYATNNPIGSAGDFITAPEISQMFGEMIALWAIGAWQALGKPTQIQIAELGPGRATLMADFLRAAKSVPEFAIAIKIKLIETSTKLATIQKTKLGDEIDIEWLETVEQLEPKPTLIIANEFLDAIPFRQFVKLQGQWLENCVGLDEHDDLAFVATHAGLANSILPVGYEDERAGSVFETAPAREAIASALSHHIATNRGAALFIDYGHEKSGFGDTFQAVKNHQSVSPLQNPGLCDLTSHVDFEAISKIAQQQHLKSLPVITQSDFLRNLGILQRAGALGASKDEKTQRQIEQDIERLISPDQMGTLFKVLCLTNPDCNIEPFAG